MSEQEYLGDPSETSITWDHDTGEVWITTNRRAMHTKMKRLGLKAQHTHGTTATYITTDKVVNLSVNKKKKLSPDRRAKLAKRLKEARNAKD